MLRKKLTDIFTTQHGLVNKAVVLHQSLRSYAVLPQDIPLSVLQLGSLYRKILENDRETLQKRVQHASDDNNPAATRALLEAINKLLNYHSADDIEIPLQSQSQESRHLKECLAFVRERSAYAAEIKQYLLDMKADIATTPWKTYVPMNVIQATNYLMRSSDDDAEDSDESYVAYDSEHWESTGECAYRWEHTMPAWADKITLELNDLHADRSIADGVLMNKYHNVIQIVNNVQDHHMHEDAYSFLKQHRGEIASISYLPLQTGAQKKLSQ